MSTWRIPLIAMILCAAGCATKQVIVVLPVEPSLVVTERLRDGLAVKLLCTLTHPPRPEDAGKVWSKENLVVRMNEEVIPYSFMFAAQDIDGIRHMTRDERQRTEREAHSQAEIALFIPETASELSITYRTTDALNKPVELTELVELSKPTNKKE